jgi:hypothetical protein
MFTVVAHQDVLPIVVRAEIELPQDRHPFAPDLRRVRALPQGYGFFPSGRSVRTRMTVRNTSPPALGLAISGDTVFYFIADAWPGMAGPSRSLTMRMHISLIHIQIW